jgi:PAS domain S-box-containing protein
MAEAFESATILLDEQGRIMTWNDAAQHMAGYRAEQVIHQPFSMFYVPEDVEMGAPQRSLDMANAKGWCEEKRLHTRDQSPAFWARVVISVLHGPDGTVCGFTKFTQDLKITSEEEIPQIDLVELHHQIARRDMKKHEDWPLFRRLVEGSPNALVLLNGAGQIKIVNRKAEEMFQYGRAEMLGKTVEFLMPDRFRSHHVAMRAEFTANRRTRPMGTGINIYGRRKDGSEFQVEIALATTESDEGAMVVANIEDVTQRVTLEVALRQAQKMEAVGQLTAGVAHDFNNLLQVITANLELLGDNLASDPASMNLVELTIGAAERGARLVHHLLAFSRRQALYPSRIDVNELFRSTTTLLARTLGSTIVVRYNPTDAALYVFADAGQLEACVVNLAINARDAMPNGGTLTISTIVLPIDQSADLSLKPGHYVVLAVEDTGVGIDPATLKKVFDPYFTTKGPGCGLGLGLSMVQGYTRQSGGDVRITSTPGKGTRVEMFLPCADPAREHEDVAIAAPPALPAAISAEGAAGQEAAPAGGSSGAKAAERILLVDDDPDALAT